ncbi:orexin receptor type 2 [Plakobranchus ocellatus]|uniref:Orexin receptor type 2 n=1 Tax=Plakobranchus ocellatus TaxID=259542 RepID=A0AAV4BPG7_9GAST|nr:orexin receptor type 2 [Plakobranchus ocellatus]
MDSSSSSRVLVFDFPQDDYDYLNSNNRSNGSSLNVTASTADSLNDSDTFNFGDFFSSNETPSVLTTDRYDVPVLYEDVSDMFYQHEDPFVIFLIIVYVIAFAVGFMGNMFVILVVLRHRHMRTLTNVFFLNLTIGDFMVTVICIPITLGNYVYLDWIYGDLMCKVTPFLQSTAVAVSVLSMLSISINRYFAIHIPLRAKILFSKTRVHLMLASIWALSVATSCPLLVVKTVTSYGIPGVYLARVCNEEWGQEKLKLVYNFITFFLLFACPLVLMSVLYFRISLALWSKDHELLLEGNGQAAKGPNDGDSYGNGPSSSSCCATVIYNAGTNNKVVQNNHQHHQYSCLSMQKQQISRNNKHRFRSPQIDRLLLQRRKTVRTLVLLVGLFAFSWFPYYVVNAWLDFNSNSSHAKAINNILYPLVQLLGLSNSSLNPILYCFLSNGFRRAFLNMCCRKKRIVLKRRGAAYGGLRRMSYTGAGTGCGGMAAGGRSGMLALTVRYRGGSEDSGVGSVETVLS